MSPDLAISEFAGTERFVLEGRLGEGGMGVVYRARDRETKGLVALKTMAYIDPPSLLRFKNEFRALADISHPNVVQLYELISEGLHWFFTMELVDGVDFLRWVRNESDPTWPTGDYSVRSWDIGAPTVDALTMPASSAISPAATRVSNKVTGGNPCDVERLRPALRQLAEGVMAIHAAGKLHRDIKPSNVLVTRDGRVVLLDFGVVGDLTTLRKQARLDDQVFGTPAYMAPEQARGMATSPAADWYSVGVVLYEALTDHLPFDGPLHDVLFSKQGSRPKLPSEISPDVPQDLDQLCADLLHPIPSNRPRGEEVLKRLQAEHKSSRSTLSVTGSQRIFVGRRQQLAELRSAFETSARGRTVTVLLKGKSGMGKTALAAQFLGDLPTDQRVVVLSGRCFEREAVPYKGMDSVVDELSRWLALAPVRDIDPAIPANIHWLTRIFPVLRAVPCIESVPEPEHDIEEPAELRRRAFAALRELLSNVASKWLLVIHIDDMQWSDVDSLLLLEELLRPPNSPPLLLLLGCREEEAEGNEVLGALDDLLTRLQKGGEVRTISVSALSSEEAVELAALSIDKERDRRSSVVRAIAEESQGMPMFVRELAVWERERLAAGNDQKMERGVSLEQVIRERVAQLPSEARSLLEVLSVASGPVPYVLAEEAIGMPRNDAIRARLRASRLVRTFRADGEELAETYHGRIRDSIVAGLEEQRRLGWHASLARAFESSGRFDPEALVEHYQGAKDVVNARRFVIAAAKAAEQGLAFLRAARLYRLAIELRADAPSYELHRKAGDALVNAGRSAEAGDEYLSGARTAPDELAIELRRLAAEHYLKSGRDGEGLTVLREVLPAVSMQYPESMPAAVSSLLWNRARVRLQSLKFDPRPAGACSPHELAKVDVAFSAAAGLAMVDSIRGADFAARHLLLALEVGEPIRICRALALEAGNSAAVGEGSRERIERMVRMAETLALRSDDPHGVALAKVAAGLVRAFSGEWRSARLALDEAEVILRERCRAVTWELTNTRAWSCNSLILCGELASASARVPDIVREARERSDNFALMHIVYPECIMHLCADDPDAAWKIATDIHNFCYSVGSRFTPGHWGSLVSTISVHRYRRRGRAAREHVEAEWGRLKASQYLRVHVMRVCSVFERALSAVAAYEDGADAGALHDAERFSKQLTADKPEYAPPMGRLIAGCIAAARGQRENAVKQLTNAVSGLERADLGYLATCARHRLGMLISGDEGRELVASCEAEFGRQRVMNVESCLAMSAPGFSRLLGA